MIASPPTHAASFFTVGSLPATRIFQTATLLQNGKVLVAGGISTNGMSQASAELYDPGTGVWTAINPMNIPRNQHTAILLPNGKVLVTGGQNASGVPVTTSELYDPATGSWTTTGSMGAARAVHTTTLLVEWQGAGGGRRQFQRLCRGVGNL